MERPLLTMKKLGVISFFLIYLAMPTVAFSDWHEFIPQVYSSEWELDIDMIHQSNQSLVNGAGYTETSNAFTERLIYSSTGVIYHPRFIQYLFKLGGGVNENEFENTATGSQSNPWIIKPIIEYEIRASVLPEHPYNLELFTLRRSPFTNVMYSSDLTLTDTESGAIFRYKLKPWRFSLSFLSTVLDSVQYTTDTRSFTAAAGYAKGWLANSLSYQHLDSSTVYTTSSAEYTANNFAFQNDMQFLKGKGLLTSRVTYDSFNQTSTFSSVDDKRLTWSEQGYMELPWNFFLNLSYLYFQETDDTTQQGYPPADLKNTNNNLGMTLTQRLYQSLTTTYAFNYTTNNSLTGDVDTLSNALTLGYVKSIPWGRLLAGFVVNRISVNRTGTEAAINEIQNAALFGFFTLNNPFVDTNTIDMTVKSPTTGILIPMQENVDYLVQLFGNNVRIQIIAIPPLAQQIDPAYVYEFHVNYGINSGNVDILQKDWGYNVRFELFNNLVNPYYSYYESRQDIISGALPGGPENSQSTTAGLELQKQPFYLVGEYRNFESTINPSTQVRAEGRYQQNIVETLNVYARAYYLKIHYTASESNPQFVPYYQDTTGGDLTVVKKFEHNLNLSAGGSYTQTTGLIDTKAYSFNGLLGWLFGKLDLSLQANVSHSQGDISGSRSTTWYKFFYLSIKRKLTD
ncbi:MAG: hypothetical protein ACLPX5_06735 [Dissulfurispiraceae bacterium]